MAEGWDNMSTDEKDQAPIFLRPDPPLGDQRQENNRTIIGRYNGYSADEVARLCNELRVSEIDFLHLTLPFIDAVIAEKT